MISPQDLHYFLAMAEHLNLRQTALKIHVTQPTLTLALQRLEAQLEAKLFERTKRGLILTPQGTNLRRSAQALLPQWQGLRTSLKQDAESMRGEIKIGCHVSVANYALERICPDLLSRHPYLDVKLIHDLSRRILSGVLAGEVDLGLVINPQPHPDLVLRPLGTDEVRLWQTSRARRGPPAALIYDPALAQAQWILRQSKHGKLPARRIESSSLEVIAELTRLGLGLGILPARVAKRHGLVPYVKSPIFRDELFLVLRASARHLRVIARKIESDWQNDA